MWVTKCGKLLRGTGDSGYTNLTGFLLKAGQGDQTSLGRYNQISRVGD